MTDTLLWYKSTFCEAEPLSNVSYSKVLTLKVLWGVEQVVNLFCSIDQNKFGCMLDNSLHLLSDAAIQSGKQSLCSAQSTLYL